MIFFSRMFDVSLGTLRGIFLHKGFKKLVPIMGFFEVLIWIVVVSQVMKNLNNWMCYFAWAGGYAMGTVVGMKIEERLALGMRVIRIITHQNCEALIEALKIKRHGVTVIDGHGAMGKIKMLFTVVKRKEVKEVESLIADFHPNAFYSVEDITTVRRGTFMPNEHDRFQMFRQLFGIHR
jgi:uncharacterized protein YebE (UPF0316 family)